MKDLSASIVVYKNAVEILEKTIQSFLRNTLDSKLYIIDNSSTDRLKALVNDPRIIYRYNNRDSEREFSNKRTVQQLAESR